MKNMILNRNLILGAMVALGLFFCGTTTALAQIGAFPQGENREGAVDGYTLPRTVVSVTMVVEREVILRGPYAKFAAQYLGISGASMSDKENYKIIDASLGYYEEPDPTQTYHLSRAMAQPSKVFHWLSVTPPSKSLLSDSDYKGAEMGNNNPFTDISLTPLQGATVTQNGLANRESFGNLPVNRTSSLEKSVQQMASEAADAIFTLRKRRFDLVTGEIGDNVFGAGLKVALEEMKRIEIEYLDLFIGKRYTQRIVRTFSVLPQAQNKGAVVVCRFTPSKGVVSDADLSGSPIVIEMSAELGATTASGLNGTDGSSKKGSSESVSYRVPSVQIVKLVDGTTELARERVPIFQMGAVTSAPVVF